MHDCGRVQYPIAFILYMPESMPALKKVMYSQPVPRLTEKSMVKKHYVLEDPEDFDKDWLDERLA